MSCLSHYKHFHRSLKLNLFGYYAEQYRHWLYNYRMVHVFWNFHVRPYWFLHYFLRVQYAKTYQTQPLKIYGNKNILYYFGKITVCSKLINKKLRYKRIFYMFCYREVFVYIQAIYCQLIQKEFSNRKYWRLTKQF